MIGIICSITESLGYNPVAVKGPGIRPEGFTPLTTTAGFQMGVGSKSDKGCTTMVDAIAAAKGGEAVMNGVNAGDLDLGFMAGI